MTRRELENIISEVSGAARKYGRLREARDELMSSGEYTYDELKRSEDASSEALFASEGAKNEAINKLCEALGIT